MLELSSVLYIFVAVYSAGLLLPFLAGERAQFIAITSVYRPLSLSLVIVHCIAAYLSGLHVVLEVFASTAILMLPLSVRQELLDQPQKIFGTNPFSKMLWLGSTILCLVLFGRFFLGPSTEYGYLIIMVAILAQISLTIEIFKNLKASKSIHLFYAMFSVALPLILFIIKIFLISFESNYRYNFVLVDQNDLTFLLRLVVAASFFILLNSITNFQFQKLWVKEREISLTSEREALDSILALSQAQDSETGSRIIRKKKYVNLLIDNLKRKAWITMPDLYVPMDQLFGIGILRHNQNYATDGGNELLERLDQDASLPSDSIVQPAQLMAVADVYDVLTSQRPWKRSWTHERAVNEITKMADNRLDPMILKAFLEEELAFSVIADVWRDDP